MRETQPSTSMPLVSIVIPVFNGARWLGDAIDSALAQTYLNTEVIVVDDGSNDDGQTKALAKSYGDQIRFISKSNGGVASALNAGIASMRGEFFSWLSHDDLYHPRKIETQLSAALELDEPVVVFGDVTVIDEADRKVADVTFTNPQHASEHAMWHVLEGRLSGCSLLIPRVCFDACGTFDEKLPTTQDYELWFRLAQKFRFVPAAGFLTMSRTHSEQGSRDPRHLIEASLSWMNYVNDLPEDVRAGMARNEFALALRLAQLPAMQAYPGLQKFAARIKAKACAASKITLVLDPRCCESPAVAFTALADAGYSVDGTVILEHPGERQDGSIYAANETTRSAHRISVGTDADIAEVAAALLGRADDDGVFLCWDDAHFSDWSHVASLLEKTLSEEIDGSFAADAQDNPLAGMCVRASTLREASRRALGGKKHALLHELAFLGCVPRRRDRVGTQTAASWQPVPVETVVPSPTASSFAITDESDSSHQEPQSAGKGDRANERDEPAHVQAQLAASRLPYLGRFEVLRMLRRPLLDERRLEHALSRAERLRHRSGLLYHPRLWYLEKLLGVRGKIDRVWYWRTYPDIGRDIDPVLHYLHHGWREGRDPSPHFSTSAYIAKAAVPLKINPLSHATFYGEGNSGNLQMGSFWTTRLLRRPLASAKGAETILSVATRMRRMLGRRLSKAHIRVVEWLFGVRGKIDRDWYARTQMTADEGTLDPSLHYLTIGWKRGLSASPSDVGGADLSAFAELKHLNPLSRRTFLGVAANTETSGLEQTGGAEDQAGDSGIDGQDTALGDVPGLVAHVSELATPSMQATPFIEAKPEPMQSAPTGSRKTLAAELVLVSDGSDVANDWIRIVQRAVDPQINTIRVEIEGDDLVISDGPSTFLYDAANDLRSASIHLLERGVRRVDRVGLPSSDTMIDLLDLLDRPVDLTLVSRIEVSSENVMLDRADRVLVANPEIMRDLKHSPAEVKATLVPMPKERERFGFKVSRRSPPRGEPFRVLAVSALPQADTSSRLKSIGKLIDARKLGIEIHAMQDCIGVSSEQSLHWLGDGQRNELVEGVGAADPHLIWFLADPDELVTPLLLDAAGLGLPIFFTGSAVAAQRLHGRPYSWASTDVSPESVVDQFEMLRQNSMDLPASGISRSEMQASPPFYPQIYLNWHSDEK